MKEPVWLAQAKEIRIKNPTYGHKAIAMMLDVPRTTVQRWLNICEKTGEIQRAVLDYSKGNHNKVLEKVEVLPKTEKELIAEQKRKIIADNEKRIEKEIVRTKALTEILLDKIVSAVAVQQKIEIEPLNIPHRKSASEEEVILDISDIQAGTKILLETTGGLNEYNFEILERQIARFLISVTSICRRHMEIAPIKKLHIFCLGDMVEGMGIFLGQAQQVDQDAYNQCFKLGDLLSKLYIELLNVFKEIEISCVGGNHGRIGLKGENPHWVNWDLIMYKYIETKLQNYDRIKFNVPLSWWFIKEIQGKKHLLVHGDDIKGWAGIPFYGIDRAKSNYKEMLETIGEEFDYAHLAHFHTAAELPLMGGGFISINGCWTGSSILGLKMMGKTIQPTQWIRGTHPEFGVTWSYKVRL